MPKKEGAPLPNPETMSKERSLINKFKDRKLVDPGGKEVVMNKTARTALFMQMEKMSDLIEVEFENDNTAPVISYKQDFEYGQETVHKIIFPSSKLELDNSHDRVREFLAEKMEIDFGNITVDMLSTFYLMGAAKRYFANRNITYDEGEKKLREGLGNNDTHDPEGFEADEYASKFMVEHKFLFNSDENSNLGRWSVLDD